MTDPTIARRRQHLPIFATIWISLFVVVAASVHIGRRGSHRVRGVLTGGSIGRLVDDDAGGFRR
jgi:hypothetical protein